MPIDWNVAISYALLVQIAKSVQPNAPYTDTEYAAIQAAGYVFVRPIYGNDLSVESKPDLALPVSFGFLAISPTTKELVAAIRGTDNLWEWIDDARFLAIPCPIAGSKGFTEDGFTTVYQSFRVGSDPGEITAKDSIQSYLASGAAETVTVCGHSLGGSLATLLTIDVALNTSCTTPTSYTFASPRTGDPIFADFYDATVPHTWRVLNRKDLVPKLPPPLPLPYKHVNEPVELYPIRGTINPTIPCMHHLTTYLWLMGAQAAPQIGYVLDTDCKPPAVLPSI